MKSSHFFWQDPGYIRTVYTPEPHDLARFEPPGPMQGTTSYTIRFEHDVDLPHDTHQRDDWPASDLPDAFGLGGREPSGQTTIGLGRWDISSATRP